MNADDFLQDHAKWKYGKGKTNEVELQRTWLMAQSGHCFPFDGDVKFELDRLRDMGMICTVHPDTNSAAMGLLQAGVIAKRKSNEAI